MMPQLLRRVYFLICTITAVTSTQNPRMVFSTKDTVRRRLPIPGNLSYVQTLLQQDPDTITVVGRTYLSSFNFSSPQMPVKRQVHWPDCSDKDCHPDILVIHKRGADRAFLCGLKGSETICCEVNLLEENLMCRSTDYLVEIAATIQAFTIKERELSALVDTAAGAELFITNSGNLPNVGIHMYGNRRITPSHHVKGHQIMKEQHYVGLMLDREPQNSLQDKVYAFFREKNRGNDFYSEMWLPYVIRVCMADLGGPKNNLQASWTSQLSARLYCGDSNSRRYFSQLVDVATVEAARREDARVYGLFRNKWGFTAVCVYSMQDIEQVFRSSPFKGDEDGKFNRSRDCVADSRDIDVKTLDKIKSVSEMEQWVLPVQRSAPLLMSHRNYTHIIVDSYPEKRNAGWGLLFLSLNHGGVHKVLHDGNHSFIIAEYQPFRSRGHISSMFLHPSSRKLYVSTGRELIQMEVTNCSLYGATCSECVLARDPDCAWDGKQCSPVTRDALQDVRAGDHSICVTQSSGEVDMDTITLLHNSSYFLQCPISSLHAKYTWNHHGNHIPCTLSDGQCLHLIMGMGLEQEGIYQCMLEEKGFNRVQAQYILQLNGGSAGSISRPLMFLCLMVALVTVVCCVS